ncbi:MAG: hypothetical protein ACI9FG_001055 [Crocinitomicaceae bacterium]|jgi:hypothetical protein
MLAIIPMVLTTFPEHESVSWLVLSNVSFFGVLIGQQLFSIFSNILSFTMGGAFRVGVQIEDKEVIDKSEPNWISFEKAYGTLRWLQVIASSLNLIFAASIGYFALSNILEGTDGSTQVFGAFLVLLVTEFFFLAFGNYQIALRGMNEVSLLNRWQTLMALLSVCAGLAVLGSGGGILATTCAMQSVLLIHLLCMRKLARNARGGVISCFSKLKFDRVIFEDAWRPLWKQSIVAFTALGFLQVVGVIFSFSAEPAEVGSYFLLLRLCGFVNSVSHEPLASVSPRFSRFIAQGQRSEIADEVIVRMAICLGIYICGMFIVTFIVPTLLIFIGANVVLPSLLATATYCCFSCYAKYFTLGQRITAFGNHIIQYWERVFACLIGLILIYFLAPRYGVLGIVLGFNFPYPFLFRLKSIFEASRFLDVSTSRMLLIGLMPAIYIASCSLYILWGFSQP